MLRISDITLRRGARVLLERASMNVHPGQKVGLIGPNGSGKSSLFALIRHELHADSGDVSYPPGWVLSHVAQETPAVARPALEFVMDGDVELREVERAMADEHGEKLAELMAHYDHIGGYQAKARAQTLLAGLGFDEPAQGRHIADFSGGWRMRLNLGRALMCRSDLLLLDEPTNHLDLDAVIWLQDYLRDYPGTLLLISHDREFLDAVTSHSLHLELLKATLYSGNYSTFERTRAERLALQAATYVKQQRQVAHLHAFITRFKAKASKARQAQSRVKQLERLELVAPAHWDSEFDFEFRTPERL